MSITVSQLDAEVRATRGIIRFFVHLQARGKTWDTGLESTGNLASFQKFQKVRLIAWLLLVFQEGVPQELSFDPAGFADLVSTCCSAPKTRTVGSLALHLLMLAQTLPNQDLFTRPFFQQGQVLLDLVFKKKVVQFPSLEERYVETEKRFIF